MRFTKAQNIKSILAEELGIKPSVAITCVKPSGTVSQLVDSASGIHTRHSDYYIRTVRADKKDPIAQLMVDQGVYHEDDITKPEHTLQQLCLIGLLLIYLNGIK